MGTNFLKCASVAGYCMLLQFGLGTVLVLSVLCHELTKAVMVVIFFVPQ